jgi:hypothetical protein
MSYDAGGHAAANEESESSAPVSSSDHEEIDFFQFGSAKDLLTDGICAA